jgi:hypothetical protein
MIGDLGRNTEGSGFILIWIGLHSMRQLLVTANIVPSSQILATLITETIRSSKTSILTRATGPNIPEDGILHTNQLLQDLVLHF